MNLLFLGGTRFVGLAMLERAAARGHKLWVVHRGGTELPSRIRPFVTEILCDRNHVADYLPQGMTWNAVVDCCCYVPNQARSAVAALKDRCDVFAYVSTVSVYPGDLKVHDEREILLYPSVDEDAETYTPETYGPLKLACEIIIGQAFGDKFLSIRPTIVVGPNDYTDRFTYWVLRLSGVLGNKQVLVPEGCPSCFQYIDSDDLARFALNLLEADQRGIFNGVGPSTATQFGQVILALHQHFNKVELVEAHEDWLKEHQVLPGKDLPMWRPNDSEASKWTVDITKSMLAGLTFTRLTDIADKIIKDRQEKNDFSLKVGLTLEREADLIKAYLA